MRRWIVVTALLVVATGVAAPGAAPQLTLTQDLPEQADRLVEETWRSFLAAFPLRHGCIGDVVVEAVRDLEEGDASYSRSRNSVRLLIPTTPERFAESLAHELGHHLETGCDPAAAMGEAFLRAQGLAPGGDWDQGETWYQTPSEHFAEAVVEIVVGERVAHARDIELSGRAVTMVRAWGGP